MAHSSVGIMNQVQWAGFLEKAEYELDPKRCCC